MATIEEEIQQRHFKSPQHKAQINLIFTAAWINNNTANVLKPYNISTQQFNLLRILRGQHPKPATVKLLTERMLDKMSNASRLVDKLLEKGLVERHICQSDRRRVDVRITEAGMALLARASEDVERSMLQQVALNEAEAEQLNALLDKMRD